MSTTAVLPNPVKAAAASAAALQNVTHRYGSHTALRDLSLTLHPGEVVALLGPNGAGKTTAVKLLLGLLKPSEGAVTVFGKSPTDRIVRQRIGAMLQVARVPETLTVGEYLDLFRSYYPHPLPTAQIIASAGLEGIEKRQFKDLSGGQKQRMLFALALCGDPDLVFLDEPTLGMDIETRHNLWREVRALADRGKTVLLTTHYLEEADTLADRILVIAEGAVVAQGTPTEIKSRVTGRKIKCVTRLQKAFLLSLPGVRSVDATGAGITLTVDAAEDVLRTMLAADPSLHSLEVSSPALEDAFLALTKKEIA
ncbi:ABC transporter ATP-binding protein [Terriglobus roseus]|uniref:ABC-2 type transport system ATP-binding protein n=1 Tax=Terriglobus roseus TaxID=392734 RepID=A0A1H4LCE2_9BACT|nr:ABC transporter ATP-binding protein [Terriglobus roseus]SEB68138.1 ABC-2 type transport system ATP-binding protein [Terriglobus roseus]